jgi:hypothetical protein
MNPRQQTIKAKIEATVSAACCAEISYKSEWLGYLPFGVYHWIECLGVDITKDFPPDWVSEDLLALEQAGFLHKIQEYLNPKDEYDICIKYRVQNSAREQA